MEQPVGVGIFHEYAQVVSDKPSVKEEKPATVSTEAIPADQTKRWVFCLRKMGYTPGLLISAFVKELRLGHEPGALYWLEVWRRTALECEKLRRELLDTKDDLPLEAGQDYAQILRSVPKVLLHHALEEGLPSYTVTYFVALDQSTEALNSSTFRHSLTHGVTNFCQAPKFWESNKGRATEIASRRAERMAKAAFDDPSKAIPIPPYAIDATTDQGKKKMQAGEAIDDRFSGTATGRTKMSMHFAKFGCLSPEKRDSDYGWSGQSSDPTEDHNVNLRMVEKSEVEGMEREDFPFGANVGNPDEPF